MPDEMAGRLSPGVNLYRKKNNIVYGPKGTDVTITTFSLDQPEFTFNHVLNFIDQLRSSEVKAEQVLADLSKVPLALFSINSAKQGKLEQMNPQVQHTLYELSLYLCQKNMSRGLSNFMIILRKKETTMFFLLTEDTLVIILQRIRCLKAQHTKYESIKIRKKIFLLSLMPRN